MPTELPRGIKNLFNHGHSVLLKCLRKLLRQTPHILPKRYHKSFKPWALCSTQNYEESQMPKEVIEADHPPLAKEASDGFLLILPRGIKNFFNHGHSVALRVMKNLKCPSKLLRQSIHHWPKRHLMDVY